MGCVFAVEAYLAQAWRVSCKMGGFCDSRGMWVKGREDAGKMGMIRDVCGLWVAGRKSTRDPDLSLLFIVLRGSIQIHTYDSYV